MQICHDKCALQPLNLLFYCSSVFKMILISKCKTAVLVLVNNLKISIFKIIASFMKQVIKHLHVNANIKSCRLQLSTLFADKGNQGSNCKKGSFLVKTHAKTFKAHANATCGKCVAQLGSCVPLCVSMTQCNVNSPSQESNYTVFSQLFSCFSLRG